MEKYKARQLAEQWCTAWNERSIDQIMIHYAEDIIFYSPTVLTRWGFADGKITGKELLKKHFLKGLELAPNLRFDLTDVLMGNDGFTLLYKRENRNFVADVVVLDEYDKITLTRAYYS